MLPSVVFFCAQVWLKSSVCAWHHFLPHIHPYIKGDQSCSLLNLSSFFVLPLLLWLTGVSEMYWTVHFKPALYWKAILCDLAAISMSQRCATNLIELWFQRPHLIWSLMRSNFFTLINQPKASLALLTPFSSYSSETGHHTGVCHFSNSVWPFWLCFACCDNLYFVLT